MVKIKICGVTCVQDTLWAASLGVDFIGLNFVPGSPRKVSVKLATTITNQLPIFVTPVGVFANTELSMIEQTLAHVPLKAVQLHGEESPELCAALKAKGLTVIKVIPMYYPQHPDHLPAPPPIHPGGEGSERVLPSPLVGEGSLARRTGAPSQRWVPGRANKPDRAQARARAGERPGTGAAERALPGPRAQRGGGEGKVLTGINWEAWRRYIPVVDYVLLDHVTNDQLGGTGHPFPWELAHGSDSLGVPIFLAGGLSPDNVKEAITQVHPFAVDVCSGVERTPRRKDFEKLKQFVTRAKGLI